MCFLPAIYASGGESRMTTSLQNVRPVINATGLSRSSLNRETLRFGLALSKASNNRASNCLPTSHGLKACNVKTSLPSRRNLTSDWFLSTRVYWVVLLASLSQDKPRFQSEKGRGRVNYTSPFLPPTLFLPPSPCLEIILIIALTTIYRLHTVFRIPHLTLWARFGSAAPTTSAMKSC